VLNITVYMHSSFSIHGVSKVRHKGLTDVKYAYWVTFPHSGFILPAKAIHLTKYLFIFYICSPQRIKNTAIHHFMLFLLILLCMK